MGDIWLLRHAAYQGHRPGHHAHPLAPLTDEGRQQARSAADSLPAGITRIITSTMPRAHETAQIIAHHAGLPTPTPNPLLTEWRAPSIVHGHTPDTYPAAYTTWRAERQQRPELACGDGESITELHARATQFLAWLASVVGPGGLLVLSHKVFLGVLMELDAGPAPSFERAAQDRWGFAERRKLVRHRHPTSLLAAPTGRL